MPMEVTFAVGGSQATITGVGRVEAHNDHLRCFGGVTDEDVLISQVPLDALQSITTESADDSGDAGESGGSGRSDAGGSGDCGESGGDGVRSDDAVDSDDARETDGGGDPNDDPNSVEACRGQAAIVTADPSSAGATATHTVALQVDQDVDDFAYFRVDYAAGDSKTNINDIDEDNVVRFGVDTNDDGVIEQSIATGDWSVSRGGSGYTLRFRNEEWDGSLEPGDDLILEYDGVPNPETPGTYEVELVLNGHQTARTSYTVGAGDIHSPDVTDDSGEQ